MYELRIWTWLEGHQLPCLVKDIFGIECPGCGFQTAVLLLLKRELWESVKIYPGLLPLIVFIGLAMAHFVGVKKITPGAIKFAGFVCLLIILISYLLKLIIH